MGDADGADDKSEGGEEVETRRQAKAKTKKKLEQLLFSRWPEGRKPNIRGQIVERGIDGQREAFGGLESGETLYEDDLDVDKLQSKIEQMMITGEEAWLDCLITAIERENNESESIVTSVLKTADMSDSGKKVGGSHAKHEKKPLVEFHKQADKVLQLLEYKARKKYYDELKKESENRQDELKRQNEVLHDYVWELEKEFTKVMGHIHRFKVKKEHMLAILAGLLDNKEYDYLPGVASADEAHQGDKQHLDRLRMPWPASRAAQVAVAQQVQNI